MYMLRPSRALSTFSTLRRDRTGTRPRRLAATTETTAWSWSCCAPWRAASWASPPSRTAWPRSRPPRCAFHGSRFRLRARSGQVQAQGQAQDRHLRWGYGSFDAYYGFGGLLTTLTHDELKRPNRSCAWVCLFCGGRACLFKLSACRRRQPDGSLGNGVDVLSTT